MLSNDTNLNNGCRWVTQKNPSEMSDLELADEAYASFQTLNNYLKCMNHGDILFESPEYIENKVMDIIYLLPDKEKSQDVVKYLKDMNKQYLSFVKFEELDKWISIIANVRNSFADLFLEIRN